MSKLMVFFGAARVRQQQQKVEVRVETERCDKNHCSPLFWASPAFAPGMTCPSCLHSFRFIIPILVILY